MDSIGPEDKSSFGYIMGSSMAIGAIASIIFHVFTNEGHGGEAADDINSSTSYAFNSSSGGTCVEKMTVLDWFKEPKTYLARI